MNRRSGAPRSSARVAPSSRGVASLAFGLVIVALGAGCSPAAPQATFGSGLAAVPASAAVARDERAMFARLNRDRKARGLPPLRFDERLSDIARHHSRDMRDNGFFEHESPNTGDVAARLDAAGYVFITARENLSEAPDVERSQDGLLASPHHFENIMASDITHVGIGIVEGGVRDPRNLTVTQVFARPAPDEAPERARARILERLDSERGAAGRPRPRRDERLMRLAEEHIATLDEAASPETVDRAGGAIVAALDGKAEGSLVLGAQVVASSDQVAFSAPMLEAAKCSIGIAARRVKGERGRPALQVLLLVQQHEGR